MPLIATAGASTANAYVTVSGAVQWLEGRLHTDPWFTAAAADLWAPSAALIWATRLLDEQVSWRGTPATTTQALGWPRTGVSDPYGRVLSTTTIPPVIELATTLYALALLRDTSEAPTTSAASVRVRQLGETRVEYFDPTTARTTPPQQAMPTEVRRLLVPYGRVGGGIAVPLLRT
jgi:hypothetical protein